MKYVYALFMFCLVYTLGYAQEPLYPYKAGKLFGYCTKEKRMAIPPVYITTEANDNFYICTASTGIVTVFNSRAQAIDSASYNIFRIGTGKVLLIEPYNVRDMVKLLIAQQQNSRRTLSEWTELTPSRAWTIDSLGNKTVVKDTLIAMHDGHAWVRVRNGNYQGVYDINTQQYIVPLSPDSMRIVPHKFILVSSADKCTAYTFTGKSYNIPIAASDLSKIYNDGLLLETHAKKGENGSLYTNTGKLLFAADKDWGRLIYPNEKVKALWLSHRKQTMKPDNRIALYSADGTFIKNVCTVKEWLNDMLLVAIADSAAALTTNTYLYDIVKNSWKLIYKEPFAQAPGSTFPEPTALSTDYGQFLTVKHAGYREYINGYTGKIQFSMPDSMWGHKPYRQVMGDLTYTKLIDGHWTNVRYNFVREKMDRPLTLFDPQLNIINKKYDSIVSLRILANKFAKVKRKDKYGLINSNMEETIPPVYDYLEFKNSLYAKVTKKGKTYWIDTANNVVFGGVYFDYISDYSVNGKWLAFTYQARPAYLHNNNYDYTEVAKAYIINANGEILATWDVSNVVGAAYLLTVNGKILRYHSSKFLPPTSIQLYNPATNKVDSLPYAYRDYKTLNNAAIVIICTNTDKEQGVFSALDLSPVLPFSDYEEYSGMTAKEVINTKPGMESGIILHAMKKDYESDPESKITHHTNYVKLIGGFYSVSGIKYWDEASEK